MGYYVLELLIAPILGGIASWQEVVLEVALLGNNVLEWLSEASAADTLQAFLVILAYTAALIAAAIWIFQRRDVAGAKGE